MNVRLDIPEEANLEFEKLLTVSLNNILVIYQIANLHEHNNEINMDPKWFNVLAIHLLTIPGI